MTTKNKIERLYETDFHGNIFWNKNGLLHREDGPAVERINGDKRWFYHGKYIPCNSQEEFEKLLKLKAFW